MKRSTDRILTTHVGSLARPRPVLDLASGRYLVQLLHACHDTNVGNAFVIETDLSQLEGKIGSTGGFDRFKEVEIGAVELKGSTNRMLMRPAGLLRENSSTCA